MAIAAACLSAVSGRALNSRVAVTGEVSLTGKVLPVGGVRDKVLAAHRGGATTVVLPRRNERDLAQLPADVRGALVFVLVDSLAEALAALFKAPPQPHAVAASSGPGGGALEVARDLGAPHAPRTAAAALAGADVAEVPIIESRL